MSDNWINLLVSSCRQLIAPPPQPQLSQMLLYLAYVPTALIYSVVIVGVFVMINNNAFV